MLISGGHEEINGGTILWSKFDIEDEVISAQEQCNLIVITCSH